MRKMRKTVVAGGDTPEQAEIREKNDTSKDHKDKSL